MFSTQSDNCTVFVHNFDIIFLFAAELEEPKIDIWGKGLRKNAFETLLDRQAAFSAFPTMLPLQRKNVLFQLCLNFRLQMSWIRTNSNFLSSGKELMISVTRWIFEPYSSKMRLNAFHVMYYHTKQAINKLWIHIIHFVYSRLNQDVEWSFAENINLANSIGPRQPARTAQADVGRYYSK